VNTTTPNLSLRLTRSRGACRCVQLAPETAHTPSPVWVSRVELRLGRGQARAVESFGPATRAWFEQTFAAATPVQARGWPEIASGRHSLLIAPTGSGKTLAAFLWAIDRFCRAPSSASKTKGVDILYVSPLKALVHDIERNLTTPLGGIARLAEAGGHTVRIPRVVVRTGDTSGRDRQRQLRDPGDILVTTPESLYLLLTSRARANLASVTTVILDEVHALASTKRGAHLALSLERLATLCERDPQRIGLSATARPLEDVARFVGGDRDVSIVDAGAVPQIDLRIVVPVADMTRPTQGLERSSKSDEASKSSKAQPGTGEALDNSIWPAVYPRLLELIDEHRTTIVFVNSRGLCERLSQRLNEIAGRELVLAHHGSVARERREKIEGMLGSGELKAIVATSSLELGIDMQAVDLVILVESPGGVARGLQRIGRAGHGVGEVSKGRIFPKHRGDLLESTVVAARMKQGKIEPLALPRNPLDVLAQQIVAMCALDDWELDTLERLVRRCASFAELPRDALVGVLDMLSGRYPSHAFADLRPRIVWDRQTDTLRGRRGTQHMAVLSGGTIPDRGTYAVVLGEAGPRVGELDEEMVHESAPGQNVMLGATTWRIDAITRDRVSVSPAPGESGKLPFWRGDGPGRPAQLGRAIGAFTDSLARREAPDARQWLQQEHGLDAWAAQNLVAHVHEQRTATGTLPTDRAITIERFRDELGDWRVCILSPLGARVHAPWALALQARIEAELVRCGRGQGVDVQAMWSDDGIVLRLVDVGELPSLDVLVPDPDSVEEQVVDQLARSALFAGQFRENAARALLLPRRRANARTPLWAQRLKAQQLLAVAREYPSFPIIIESYRACLQDIFDMPALVELLRAIQRGDVRVDFVETTSASPFARSLVFAYVASFLYEGDTPLAERKAQALALDRGLLRELLGHEDLTELLDPEVIDELEAQLQRRAEGWRARHADDVADLLRRVGDLDLGEIAERSENDPSPWVDELVGTRRITPIEIGGSERYIDPQDAELYARALHAHAAEAMSTLIERWAKTHGPFESTELAQRFGVDEARILPVLEGLENVGTLARGTFRGGARGTRQWCDAEVLRRIKQRTLGRLRAEIAPVNPAVLGRFLPDWHGTGAHRIGAGRLEEVLARLEGLPLPYDELERVIVPARVPGFAPPMLDELGAMGSIVWVGHGVLGGRDGRVALFRRDRVASLLDPPVASAQLGPLHHAILERLETRGASFFVELHSACGADAENATVEDALWDLVWQGLVTNDTFAPLRAARTRPSGATRRPRTRRGTRPRPTAVGGRWSLVSELLGEQTHATVRAHARATALLERHGIVTREVATLEPVPGGFAAVYPVLRAMEESGKVRRGFFIDGLGGAQFASAGAVDRLRELRGRDDRPVLVLSAVDPANPYGWLLPWPTRDEGGAARRVAGATVVLVGGEAALYLDRGARRLLTFPAADDPEVALMAARALTEVARRRRGKLLRIESIDGQAARTSNVAATLRKADFTSDPRGLILEAR
jgi:ATP-dependent helicase Lhr and Lhr-like helicase